VSWYPLLSPKPFAEYKPQEYLDYIKTLRIVPENKARSKTVTGVYIYNDKKFMTSVEDRTAFTDQEINLLANEFKIEKDKLIKNLIAKKLVVLDANGNTIQKPKRDAKHEPLARRKKVSEDKSLKPKPAKRLRKEVSLSSESEPST